MTRQEIYKEKICKYCKKNCNKKIKVVNKKSTICMKCVDYEPREIKKRKKIPGYWQGW